MRGLGRQEQPLGVYGLRITGTALRPDAGLVPVEAHAPAVHLELVPGCAARDVRDGDETRLDLGRRGGVLFRLEAAPPTATVLSPQTLSPEALVHPVLSLVAAAHSRWLGRITLHGGAVSLPGGALALLADKEHGKSTTLAALAARGLPVLTDDLVVVDEAQHVLCGPRSIDLRPAAARHLGTGRYIGDIGQRPRHRVALPVAPAQAPLRALVELCWSDDDVRLERLPVAEAVRVVHRHLSMLLLGAPPPGLLDLVRVPVLRLHRPRRWDLLDMSVDLLLRELVTR